MEGSHSGLVHALGKRAYRKVSRVQISPPPPIFRIRILTKTYRQESHFEKSRLSASLSLSRRIKTYRRRASVSFIIFHRTFVFSWCNDNSDVLFVFAVKIISHNNLAIPRNSYISCSPATPDTFDLAQLNQTIKRLANCTECDIRCLDDFAWGRFVNA